MKTKAIVLIAITAIVTVSFTFASIKPAEKKQISTSTKSTDAPAGGFATEDKF